jgi:ABC-type lipoprotein release transport system permease subunit
MGYRVRRTLRRRWAAALAVTAIVAVVTGAVLTLVAGARRTAHAPDAYTKWVGGDIAASLQQQSGPPRTAEIAALPGVTGVDGMTFAFAGFLDRHGTPAENAIAFVGTRPYGTRLIAGRDAKPDRPHEFVAEDATAKALHVKPGDTVHVVSWSREQATHGEGFNAPPKGPAFDATLVGVFRSPTSLEDESKIAILSPALLKQNIGLVTTLINVRLDAGTTRKQLRAEIDKLPHGSAISVAPGQVISDEIRTGVDAVARGIWLMALVAGVAAVVALGQILTRHVRLPSTEGDPLRALGYSHTQLRGEPVLHAAVPAAAGIAVGAALAILASSIFPAGFVRVLEPHAGRRVDAVTLVVGGIALLLLILGWVAIAISFAGRAPARRSRPRASETIARRVPAPAVATGANFALTGRDGRSSGAAGTLAALAFIVAALIGATSFATSVDRLVTDQGRFGSNYTYAVGDNSDLNPAALRKALGNDPNISTMTILSAGHARAGVKTVPLIGVEYVRGRGGPRVLEGRLPRADDEVALGRLTANDLGKHIGDELSLRGAHGPMTLRVVGLTVVPTVGGNDGVGQGAVLNAQTQARLDPDPGTTLAAVQLAPHAASDARSEIKRRTGVAPGLESRPAVIVNVGRVRTIPIALAALLAALALLTLIHALIVSIQYRRRDVAVLRAIGADRRFVTRTVHWQATVLSVLPLLVAVPFGLLAGSFVFRAFVDRIGAWPEPTYSVIGLVSIAFAFVVVANLIALIPARRARRVPAARLLNSE